MPGPCSWCGVTPILIFVRLQGDEGYQDTLDSAEAVAKVNTR